MPNVRSLVGVDVRMLDNDFSFIRRKPTQTAAANRCCAIQIEIDVAGAGDLHSLDTVEFSYFRDKFFCDSTRSFLEMTRKLKRNGRSEFAEIHFRSLVQNDFRRLDVALCSYR